MRRVSVFLFFSFIFNIIFWFFLQIFVYIGSSEQVQTDITRSSLKPRVLLGRRFYFRCIFGTK
jgi:hypothetical protein